MSLLFHVSDLHFGREDRMALDWFADAVKNERPDAVIVTGDLTMRARSREYAAAQDWLVSLNVPVSLEIGNHDLPYYNPFKRLVSPFKRFRRVERAIEQPLNLPDMILVPLRTTARAQMRLNWASGAVSQRSLHLALSTLDNKPPGALAIVACHHPLAPSDNMPVDGATTCGLEAIDALAAAGADVVLSGHVHDAFDRVWISSSRPLRLIGAGTLSTRLRQSDPSFNALLVQDGLLESTVRSMR